MPKTRPKKYLGQHFLIDQNIVHQIIQNFAIQPHDHLVEIGPGRGALTQALIGQAQRLDLIEVDRHLMAALEKQFIKPLYAIYLHLENVLTFDFKKLIQNTTPLRLIGNLPYNISTPLLFYLLNFKSLIQDCLFMLQEEVVQRLIATPNTKHYGRLSVMLQYHFKLTKLFSVPPEAFYPPPKVHSAMIHLTPIQPIPYPAKDYACFEKIVAQAFLHKRKTLKNNLAAVVHASDWKQAQIDPTLRAEALSVANFVSLCNILSHSTRT